MMNLDRVYQHELAGLRIEGYELVDARLERGDCYATLTHSNGHIARINLYDTIGIIVISIGNKVVKTISRDD